jgi:hypothetical protein
MMLKMVAAGATELFVLASPLACAQAPSTGAGERLSAADVGTLTDARINSAGSTYDWELSTVYLELAAECFNKSRTANNAGAMEAFQRMGYRYFVQAAALNPMLRLNHDTSRSLP